MRCQSICIVLEEFNLIVISRRHKLVLCFFFLFVNSYYKRLLGCISYNSNLQSIKVLTKLQQILVFHCKRQPSCTQRSFRIPETNKETVFGAWSMICCVLTSSTQICEPQLLLFRILRSYSKVLAPGSTKAPAMAIRPLALQRLEDMLTSME